MKEDLYRAKVQAFTNEMIQTSEKYMEVLSSQQDSLEQIWTDQNLRLKVSEESNAERLRLQLERDKQWIQIVEENQRLELQISSKMQQINQKNDYFPGDIESFSNCISQPSIGPDQLKKEVLKSMTEDILLTYTTLKQAEQASAQF